ncbi:MAG: spore cortex biosynthesis protein YabQ [Firmicutes bacterium]|nr:spore cortex biosynthesis protein YabQ [Bacillota bacterium]MDH7496341.1 spore cortex biosynthesis protein YabQ [Bacillota bacterium]
MIEPVGSQAFTLLVTVLTGVIVGMSFDLYRVARCVFGLGPVLTAVGDILFSLFAATVAFTFLLATCWGEVRFFMFLGFGAGFAGYRAVLGHRVIGGAVSMVEACRSLRRQASLGVREASFRLRRTAAMVRKHVARGRLASRIAHRMLHHPRRRS